MKLYFLFCFLFEFVISTQAQQMPKDFSFYYAFGFELSKTADSRTIFNSNDNLLTVYGIDTVLKFPLTLKPEEKKLIYNELLKIDFKNYPNEYFPQTPDSGFYMESPCQYYTLITHQTSSSKEVNWNDSYRSYKSDSRYQALLNLDKLIQKIIWSYNPLKDYNPKRMRY